MKKEIWKDIKGYEGLYQVSNLGRVKSLNYNHTGREEILKSQKDKYDYLCVNLYRNGVMKRYTIHRLEYEAFYGKIPDGMQVNHINEDKTDNSLENLNLMTPKENTNWGTGIKRRAEKQINGKKSKCIIQYDLSNNYIKEFPSTKEIERQLGFAHNNISKCCLNKIKTVYGYIWRYKESAA